MKESPRDENSFWYFRANVDVPILRDITVGWTGILKGASVPCVWPLDPTTGDYDTDSYSSHTMVTAFRARALIGHRAAVEGRLSIERVDGRFGSMNSGETTFHFKCGIHGCFRF